MHTNHHARRLAEALADAGLDADEAGAWANSHPHAGVSALVATATAWRGSGIPADDAVRWQQAGWRPQESTSWWLRGFTPAQATFVSRRLQATAPPPADGRPAADPTTEWLTSGLSPDDIVLCLATGHLTLDSASEVVDAMAKDATLRGTLRLQAATAGADLAALRDVPR